MSCLFCKIANRQAQADVIYQDEDFVAFHDIHPVAPTHVLIIPRKHIASLAESSVDDSSVLGHLLVVAREVAKSEGLDQGFRVVLNSGADGGQSVPHLHLHLLGKRPLEWPPG